MARLIKTICLKIKPLKTSILLLTIVMLNFNQQNLFAFTANAPDNLDTVRVYQYDSSRKCEKGSLSLESMASSLDPITIIKSQKLHDGMMRTSVCGNSTGWANVYTIKKNDLKKALDLGFEEWSK